MRKLLCASMLALAMPALVSCAAVSAVAAATSTEPIGNRITMDERGLYAVEALYNVPANAYRNAVVHKVMTPALRARVRPLLLELRAARNLARTAYKVGDAAGWNARVVELLRLKGQITAMLPAT